ncbi:MAG: hypothetical protein HY884_01810 [Deltaproteobacteria bacterium]|nr:hypothetical protein [Deltaproteobacteria bacterium]
MQNTIRILEEIQKLDIEIHSIEVEEKNYLTKIEEAGAELKRLEEFRAKVASELSELNALLSNAQERIRQGVEKIQKTEKRISEIKNTKELNALNKEINAANKAKKLAEEETERIASKLNDKKTLLDEKDSLQTLKDSEQVQLAKDLEEKKGLWVSRITGKRRLKEETASRIPPDIYKKYENIRAKRAGIGLALVKNEACQACNIHIPPQVYILLKKGVDELMTCPHCHRILYVENNAKQPV